MSVPAVNPKPDSCDIQSINDYYSAAFGSGSGNGGGTGCGTTSDTYEETVVTNTGDGCYCYTIYEVTDYYYCETYQYSTRSAVGYYCDSC